MRPELTSNWGMAFLTYSIFLCEPFLTLLFCKGFSFEDSQSDLLKDRVARLVLKILDILNPLDQLMLF